MYRSIRIMDSALIQTLLNKTVFLVFNLVVQSGLLCDGKDYSYISKPSYDKLRKQQNQEPVYGLGETGAIIIGAVVGGMVFFAIVLTIILVFVFRRHGYCLCESQSERQETKQTVSVAKNDLVVKYPFIKNENQEASISSESKHGEGVVKYPLNKS